MNSLNSFFDPNARTSEVFAMGGAGHVALVVILFGLLGVLIIFRKELSKLRDNRGLMAGTAAFILSIELVSLALTFIYPIEHTFERIPLHLCASLKIAVATLILLRRYDLMKYISTWSIGAGFISFVNLNLEGASFGNFMFWHYFAGHTFLFLAPILLFLTGDFRYDLRFQARSMAALAVWSLVIFFVNWKFDTNYMYTGPHNETAVPFIPDNLMVWPLNYVSYCLVGLVLLSVVYAVLRICQGRMDDASTRGATAPLSGATSGR